MAETDRRTTIDGDQITDHTITPVEVEYEESPENFKSLIYNSASGKFKWFHTLIRGQIFQ